MLTKSERETKELGECFGRQLKDRVGTVALIGGLGSGKTTFMKGLAEGFGVKEKIKSPTFVLLKEYLSSSGGRLVHVDAYRLKENFEDIGLTDYFNRALVMVEWADRLVDLLPQETKRIYFKHINETEREICWEGFADLNLLK